MGFWWEKSLIEAKAHNYCYRRLAPYIRDVAIYGRVTNVDIKGKDEIIKAYAKNTREVKGVLKDIRHICKFATRISEWECQELLYLVKAI